MAVDSAEKVAFSGETVLEKIAEILNVARKPVLKDHLMRTCGLNGRQFKKYVMGLLLPCGLLDLYPAENRGIPGPKSHHRMLYQTSKKGEIFLERYSELQRLLSVDDATLKSPFFIRRGVQWLTNMNLNFVPTVQESHT